MAFRIPICEELAKRACTGRRDWSIDSDPLSVMMLLQMIADSYMDARILWEKNKNRASEIGHDPDMYGPNEAQRKIEEWLMRTRFLPMVLSEPPKILLESDLVIPVKRERMEVLSRRSGPLRGLQTIIRRRLKSSKISEDAIAPTLVKLWILLQKRFKLAKQHPGPRKQVAYKAESKTEVSSTTTSVAYCKPRPAFPRIIPSTKPLLRRMTSADSRALISSSVRTRRIPRKSVIESATPEAPTIDLQDGYSADSHKQRAVDHAILSTSDSSNPFINENESLLRSDRRPPPLYLTLFLVFLFQCCMLLFMIGVLLAVLFKLLSIVLGFFLFWCSEDE